MADNVTIPASGSGTATPVIATDDVSGVHYQKVKLDLGGDGATTPVSGSVPINDNSGSITVDGTVAVSGTVTVDTELPAAAAISAENTAAPTAPSVYGFGLVFDGTNWDRMKGDSTDGTLVNLGTNNDVTVTSGSITADTELPAVQTHADNLAISNAPGVIGANYVYDGTNWDRQRGDSTDGTLVNLGTNNDVTVTSGSITADTELPAAAALSDNTSNPTTSLVGANLEGFDGTAWDRLRTTDASDGNGALTTTGVLTVGTGPGFARRFNPANLGTAANSTSAVDVNGATTVGVQVNTSTTGTYILEVTDDGTTWKSATAINYASAAFVTGASLTPTVGDLFVASVTGMRQFRLRTVTTLGATMAHVITASLGDTFTTLPQFTAPAALADATANPTTALAGAANLLYNGTTWDRVRGDTTNGLDVDVTRLPALVAGTANIGDVDVLTVPAPLSTTGGGTEATALRVTIANDSTGVVSIDDNGGSLTVDGTVGVSGSVDTELPTAQAHADNLAISSAPGVLASGYWYDGTNWDRARGDSTDGLLVNLGTNNDVTVTGTVTVDTELPAVQTHADNLAISNAPAVIGATYVYDGTNWDRMRGDSTDGTLVNLGTNNDVDTELPAAQTHADNLAISNAPGVIAANYAYDGTNWDRMRGDSTDGVLVNLGTNNDVTVTSISAGDNNIGNVDIVTMPNVTLAAGTNTNEVVGDVAEDQPLAGNPVRVGVRASTAIPTAMSGDGDIVSPWANRSGAQVVTNAPHVGLNSDPWNLVHEGAQYTTTQTSTVFAAGGASEKVVVTDVQIQAYGTNAGDCIVYFGTGAFARGTNRAIFDGTFKPSSTLAPGYTAKGPFISGTNGDDVMVTTTNNLNVTISIWYYVVT